jgi:hypothetical protein
MLETKSVLTQGKMFSYVSQPYCCFLPGTTAYHFKLTKTHKMKNISSMLTNKSNIWETLFRENSALIFDSLIIFKKFLFVCQKAKEGSKNVLSDLF